LESSAVFSGESVSDYLVARDDCATFIAERLWYRFISSSQPLPTDSTIKKAFAERNIASAVTALASDVAMRDPNNSLVKAPVEWFISACRALQITPSKLDSSNQLISHLQKLVQVPFSPPNVGGWPTDEAWLSSASAQYRIAFAKWLIKQGDLTPITSLSQNARVAKSMDWLGVSAWSNRTQGALRNAVGDPEEFVLLALCSPEYVVSA
jgi:uncharacterized protein (DUF1800 family)